MKRPRFFGSVVAGVVIALAGSGSALADVKVTDQTYVRHDGVSAADVTLAACSSDATTPEPDGDGAGEAQANEPAATVSPINALHLTAGANDYCPVSTIGDAWAGFYWSNDGGASWVDSLLPGYPTDMSVEGRQSPLFGLVGAAGDPVQAWDNAGHVYFGGIAFNRTRPTNGSIWVARYNWPMVATAPDYEFTTIVSLGTPSPFPFGHFEDKVQLEVDKGAESAHAGNVYLCWARFTGGANNFVEFARSTDGGRTFRVQKLSEGVHGSQFCDIAVSKDGTVFVAWRQFEFLPAADTPQKQNDAVAWVKSTNGGRSFTKPQIATEFVHWDLQDEFAFPALAGPALFEAGLSKSPEPRQFARNCGDGPLVCESGYVFHRGDTQVRIAADPTAAGDADAAYVVFDATVPGTEVATGTTFGTVESGVGSQAAVFFMKTEDGGDSWTEPQRIDPQETGHQYFPDIDIDDGTLHAVWQDSRNDTASGPGGGDFRTVPPSNQWVADNPPGSVSTGAGLETFHATSSDGGMSWTVQQVSTDVTMPQFEQFGNRDLPFFGDYNYVDASAGKVFMTWTDQRETRPGDDPRYPVDGIDGFDVWQCREFDAEDEVWSADRCPNAGGLDQNIFGFVESS